MEINSITLELMGYIDSNGHDIDNWCMGITKNIETGLYKNHNVKRIGKHCFADAETNHKAYEVIKQLNKQYNIHNVTKPEDEDGTIVFVFKSTDYTNL